MFTFFDLENETYVQNLFHNYYELKYRFVEST